MSKLTLEKELHFFEMHKAEYLKVYKNTYVVIKSNQLLGNFTTQQEAYAAGIEKYGNEPFLIKLVTDIVTPVIHVPALQMV